MWSYKVQYLYLLYMISYIHMYVCTYYKCIILGCCGFQTWATIKYHVRSVNNKLKEINLCRCIIYFLCVRMSNVITILWQFHVHSYTHIFDVKCRRAHKWDWGNTLLCWKIHSRVHMYVHIHICPRVKVITNAIAPQNVLLFRFSRKKNLLFDFYTALKSLAYKSPFHKKWNHCLHIVVKMKLYAFFAVILALLAFAVGEYQNGAQNWFGELDL